MATLSYVQFAFWYYLKYAIRIREEANIFETISLEDVEMNSPGIYESDSFWEIKRGKSGDQKMQEVVTTPHSGSRVK